LPTALVKGIQLEQNHASVLCVWYNTSGVGKEEQEDAGYHPSK